MANIGLIDADRKGRNNFPNLALMKLSAWHKKHGDNVEMVYPLYSYDKCYVSKVFDDNISPPLDYKPICNDISYGGSGFGLKNNLPDEIEHMYPDYGLYHTDKAYGFLTRGCPRGCSFCIVANKEGRASRKVSDISEWWNGQKEIVLLDPNLLACKESKILLQQLIETNATVDFTQGIDCRLLNNENIELLNKIKIKMIHFAWDFMNESDNIIKGLKFYSQNGEVKDPRKKTVYVLVNYNTTIEEDLYRIYKLKQLNYTPYVMVYDKAHASKEIKKLQRWCNNRFIFRTCDRFEDYK